MLNKNKIIIKTYLEYIKELEENNHNLKSISLTNKEITILKNKIYNLSYFDIYKYIRVSDLLWYKGKYNINLSSGINYNWNRFRNVLIDLYYHNIPNEMFYDTPISSLFQFEYIDNLPININIFKLQESDIQLLEINYVKNNYDSYFGNYNTYFTFKELIKIYSEELKFYYYKGRVYNELQLEKTYDITNSYFKKYGSNWKMISKLDLNLIELEYNLLSLNDPKDIKRSSLSEIKLIFILDNLNSKYDKHYTIEFKLEDFWLNKI